MGSVVAGLSCSHAPSIAHAFDHGKTREPGWRPLFDSMEQARQWLSATEPDALVVIYNDHVDQFFLDSWPTFTIGLGDEFPIADEGWGPRDLPPVPGAPELAAHLASSMVDSGFDLTVCHQQVVDHGVLSPLPLIDRDWAFPIIPVAFNVIWDPRPSPRRCWEFGEALRAGIESYGPMRVAVVGTGGLSHHLTGPTFGEINPEWDLEFLRMIEEEPEKLKDFTLDDLAERGGEHSVEVVQWMAMRAAVGADAQAGFRFYYPHQIMGYGGIGFTPPQAGR
ncbi:MAG: hypothetical protein ACRDO1_01110 [Nocardioidaceae bacterium]